MRAGFRTIDPDRMLKSPPGGILAPWLWKGMPTILGPKVLVFHEPRREGYELSFGWPGGHIYDFARSGTEIRGAMAQHLSDDFRMTVDEALAFVELFPADSVPDYSDRISGDPFRRVANADVAALKASLMFPD